MIPPGLQEYLALYNRGAYREAYVFLRNLMAAQPYLSQVGDLYVICAGLELTVNDNISKARELLDRARELGCHDMAAYYRTHGYVLWKAEEHESAIRDLEESVALSPTIANLAMLGKMLSGKGDERAREIWGQVLKQDPESCPAYIYLGILAAKTGDRSEAIAMAQQAETCHPSAHDIEEIALLYQEIGDVHTALNRYLEADGIAGSGLEIGIIRGTQRRRLLPQRTKQDERRQTDGSGSPGSFFSANLGASGDTILNSGPN